MARKLAMATRGKQVYTKEELFYLAGIVDSDGCIGIGKMKAGGQRTKNPRYVLMITVANTSVPLMEWLVAKFGGAYRVVRKGNDRHKDHHHWSFNNGRALWLLEELAPILIVKPQQARLGIELLSNWETPKGGRGAVTSQEEVSRREDCYQRMKVLNQTGPSVQPQRLSPLAPAMQGDAIV